ncbi:iron-containing alcohol dehydrogenase [Myxococcus sp. K15C18031901]|uniref:iron-containing alcohol dehydrogenase n=1 Tax=Myxococcus dinghuensis TaxID=2906761 RepID=UPI0020A7EE63|nr:iron-containing alcohol dehydrogenase [Myxococcus dinghuensis]MCP3102355.1 iron-containing alcohol dehydrogenase [Myxococcus dinghuensis]
MGTTSFEFATATRIVFGPGRLAEAPDVVRGLGGRRVLLVTGKDPTRAHGLADGLRARGLDVSFFPVEGEPTVEVAREGMAAVEGHDVVVAFGGGSALDAGKAIAALATNGGDPLDYLEVIGAGRALTREPLPFVAIPTTAGTGSEVTRNAVLGSRQARAKASLRSPSMLPRVALVDPDLLVGVPRAVLVHSGMDALSQLIEPFLSARATPLTDALARTGMFHSARAWRLLSRGDEAPDARTREDLALASLLGGLCLANAGLGAVHGFAAPMGGMFDAPHGAVCAALLPAVLEVNHRALTERVPDHPALPRFREVAAVLAQDDAVTGEDAARITRRLCATLRIPGLGHHGLTREQLPTLVEKARSASSMKANPLTLTDAELTEIATLAL